MTKLAEMSVKEAASKALEVILAGSYEDLKRSYPGAYNQTWQENLAAEYGYDEDGDEIDFSSLEDNESAWKEVKYEYTDEYTIDGFTAKTVAQHGGEGEGDQYWVVVSISDGETTRYFRKDGWYASYDGGYLDGDTTEVKPVEKTITVYERI